MANNRSNQAIQGQDESLGESWVDVTEAQAVTSTTTSSQGGSSTPASSITHTARYAVEEYLRLLQDAARESGSTSHRGSARSSPKSPPNSPIAAPSTGLDWHHYYLNKETKEDSEFLNDWSSRPDSIPPKNWAFRPPKNDLLSIRYARVGETSVFSKKGLATLFLTNLLSLLIGTGLGLWISKHGFFVTAVKVR